MTRFLQVIYNTPFPRRITSVFELVPGQHRCRRRKFAGIQYNMVERLLQRTADINHQDHEGWTLLHEAVWYHDWDMVDMLLSLGADVAFMNNFKETPLALAQPLKLTSLQVNSQCLPVPISNMDSAPLDIVKRLTNGKTSSVDIMFGFCAQKCSKWWSSYGTEYFLHSLKFVKPSDLEIVQLKQELDYVRVLLKCSLGIRSFWFKKMDILEHLLEAGCSRPMCFKIRQSGNSDVVRDWNEFSTNTRSLTQLSQMCIRNSIRDFSDESFDYLYLPKLLRNYTQLHHMGPA